MTLVSQYDALTKTRKMRCHHRGAVRMDSRTKGQSNLGNPITRVTERDRAWWIHLVSSSRPKGQTSAICVRNELVGPPTKSFRGHARVIFSISSQPFSRAGESSASASSSESTCCSRVACPRSARTCRHPTQPETPSARAHARCACLC
jgi:hypothetical protein